MANTTSARADFGVLLNLAFGVFKAELHADLALKGFDDLGPSFGYVFRMLDGESLSLGEVAARIGISPQGTLKIVNDMVAKRYIQRVGDATDGRVTRLVLSARGQQALAAAKRFHTRFEDGLRRRLGARSVLASRELLEAIVENQTGGTMDVGLRPF